MKTNGIITLGLTSLISILILMSSSAKAGAIQGLKMCEEIIIPSLLPILILTNIMLKSKCSIVFEKMLGTITEKMFCLPKCCATAILFGLISGYPAGALLTKSLLDDGIIDEKIANRMMHFNFSGGLAFIITAVGSIRYGDKSIGLILVLCAIIPELLIAFAERFFIKGKPKSTYLFAERLNFNEAMIEAVESTIKSLLTMVAYITLFSSICAIFPIPHFIIPFLEITNGVYEGELLPLEYCAFFISFGGICIHLQIMGIIKINYLDFFIHRLANAIFSYGLMKLYLFFFPQEQDVFSNLSSHQVEITQANYGFCVIMIIGCAVLVFDIENRKLKLR